MKHIGYVGTSSAGTPGALKIVSVDGDTGAVEKVGAAPVADSTYIAVNAARTRLYASFSDTAFGAKGFNGGLVAFALDASGTKLERLDAVATGRGAPCHLSVAPDGKSVVFAEYSTGTCGEVGLKPDGTFDKATLKVTACADPTGPSKPRQDRPHCHCARVTPDGKYTCVVDLGTDRVKIFDRAGNFVRDLVTEPAGAGPRHLIFHPNGRFAFLLFELENYVTSYRYEDGRFEAIQQLSLIPEGFTDFSKAAAIKLSEDGMQLFCTNRGHNSMAVFVVDSGTGCLSRRGIVKLNGDFPWDFEFMPGGKVLAVGFEKDGALRTFRYDAVACTFTPLAELKDVGRTFCTVF